MSNTTTSTVGQIERRTQNRVMAMFRDRLGYRYLGDWKDRAGNANVERDILTAWLRGRGHDDAIIAKVLHELDQKSAVGGGTSLYDANGDVYELLRYGVKVRPGAGEQTVTVWLVDWAEPGANDFAVAEEVTVSGEHDKRPDVVLYVNGIALAVLELKRSTVHVSEGIRQNLDSQAKTFIRPFYATVQLVMAGNDTQGLRYGVIETPEKYYLEWKEDGPGANPLDRALGQMCRQERLLEIVHDFIVFDAGTKKTCRPNQYFGVVAARQHVLDREGGIVWHTQGSGKSLTMVWLAKWIREHVPDARVLVLTDRTELDDQIEKIFKGVNEDIYRTKSAADLVEVLGRPNEWLMCSLIHKFGAGDEGDIEGFVRDVASQLPAGFRASGEFFIFVDECHRTQSGKLHEAMRALLPAATLIGFTGTPLLKRDKQKSIEVFGPYIHTYKYDEAVRDNVVLDLRYEARDIDQDITSPAKIDTWFESKTKGLTDPAKAQLKKRWGTMRKVLSSSDRLEKIVADIMLDMEIRDRLKSGHGNAMLVTSSIYSACRVYELFQKTDLAGKCAVVSSYAPTAGDIKGEGSGEGQTERLRQYEIYRKMLADHFDEPPDVAAGKVEQFEKEVTRRFIEEPGQMKLLIVVDKLLTGFDAPPATYLYIDKQMHDHGLFQAICRVNRLDDTDKEYGYIVDYKDLFKSLERSLQDYTGEAFDGYDIDDVVDLLKNRLAKGRERLEDAREKVLALCEPVARPGNTADYLRFFCATDDADPDALKQSEPKRVALYRYVASLLRAYANLANEMPEAGYSEADVETVKAEVTHAEKIREEVKLASGDAIDMKMFEPAMRHLLDTYIRAEDAERLSEFDEMTLVDLIVARGPDAIDLLPGGIRDDPDAVAETIANNVRRVIIDQQAANPKYYEKMSDLLDALIQARKKAVIDYQAFLAQVMDLAKRVVTPDVSAYPPAIDTGARRALYDNLGRDEALALRIDDAVLAVRRDGWRGHTFKERTIKRAIEAILVEPARAAEVFELVQNQHDY